MAEKKTLQEKVEDQLNCSICLDTYTNPKLLQCFHVYCQGCLVKLVVRDQEGHLVLTCPTCRQVMPIPANGVTGLPPAFHINHFLDIMAEHKKEEGPTAERELASLDRKNKDNQFCSEHDGKALELYCETCEELICYHCALKKGKHHSHNYALLDEAFEKYKKEITPSLEPMEKQLSAINEALAQWDSHCDELSVQGAAVEANIHENIGHLQKVVHEALEARKTELIGFLHQTSQEMFKGLAVQKDQIETTQAKLGSCIDFIKGGFTTISSQGEVLKMKTAILQRANGLSSAFQPDMKPNFRDAITFSSLEVHDITEMCLKYGQLSMLSVPDPPKCYTRPSSGSEIVVGEKCTVTLQAINTEGKPHGKLIESLESELVSAIKGTKAGRTRCNVERRGQSQYEISYQPTVKGRHQLHIKIAGRHVMGSPLSMTVKSPVVDLKTPIQTIKEVNLPYRLTVNKRGEVVIVEFGVPCISVFSMNGKKIRSFGSQGSGPKQFNNPCGVTVDDKGNILVADTGNRRIQKFTEKGKFLKEVKFEEITPRGIAFNSVNNKIYVTDTYNLFVHVHVLTSDLIFSSDFGAPGSAKGELNCPRDIAFDSIGNVYIADRDNSRIQVFSAEGKFLRIVRKKRGKLNWPVGVAVDGKGVIYASEYMSKCVSVFSNDGRFMLSSGEFSTPYGLAVDDSGVLYVCDYGNNRVLMF